MTKAIAPSILRCAGIASVFPVVSACAVDLDRKGGALEVDVSGVEPGFRTLRLGVDGPKVAFSQDLEVRNQTVRLAVLAGSVDVQLEARGPSGLIRTRKEDAVLIADGSASTIGFDLTARRRVFDETRSMLAELVSGELVATTTRESGLAARVEQARLDWNGHLSEVGFESATCRLIEGSDEDVRGVRDVMDAPIRLEFVGDQVGVRTMGVWSTLEGEGIHKRLELPSEVLKELQEDVQLGRFHWVLRGVPRNDLDGRYLTLEIRYYALE